MTFFCTKKYVPHVVITNPFFIIYSVHCDFIFITLESILIIPFFINTICKVSFYLCHSKSSLIILSNVLFFCITKITRLYYIARYKILNSFLNSITGTHTSCFSSLVKVFMFLFSFKLKSFNLESDQLKCRSNFVLNI